MQAHHVYPRRRTNVTDFEKKSFALADDRNKAPLAELETVTVHGQSFTRATLDPGWSWEEHIRPIAGGGTCQAAHLQVVLSGRMEVEMMDGTTEEVGPGDIIYIGPGHLARVLGDQPVQVIELEPDLAEILGDPA
jgi:quercetin dioxygenase-like cupin family protein